MAFSYVEHKGDGVTTVFPFSFSGSSPGYIRASDIVVMVKDLAGVYQEAHNFSLSGTNQVQFNVAPATPADNKPNIMIRRVVPKDKPYADFVRGNNFGQDQINRNSLQQLYALHEFLDGFLPDGYFVKSDMDFKGNSLVNVGDIDMGGSKITGLPDPTSPTDAVPKRVMDEVLPSSVAAASASATAAASSAAQSASKATESANSATASASSATAASNSAAAAHSSELAAAASAAAADVNGRVASLDLAVASIAAGEASLASSVAALQVGQSSGVVAYATQAALFADLSPAAPCKGYVGADPTPSKNGDYYKVGGSGTGSWVQSSFDRVAQAETLATNQNRADISLDAAYFEETRTSSGSVFFNGSIFYVRGITPFQSVAWANILTVCDSTITTLKTSPKGVANCIEVPHNYLLVYDMTTNLLKLLSDRSAMTSSQVAVLGCVWGRISRGQLAIRNVSLLSAASESHTSSLATLNRVYGAYLYLDQGKTTTPTIEEATDPATNNLFIKFNAIRLVGMGMSDVKLDWATIKTHINDPSRFVTSVLGTTDCMVLNDEAFVYDIANSIFKVVGRTSYDPKLHHLIALSAYGMLADGLLLRWSTATRFRTNTTNIATNTTDLSNRRLVEGARLMPQVGGRTFEEPGAASGPIYFQCVNIYMRGLVSNLSLSWAALVASYCDPSIVFENSPRGLINAIKVSHGNYLVWDNTISKLKMVGWSSYEPKTQVLLLDADQGTISGKGVWAPLALADRVAAASTSAAASGVSPNAAMAGVKIIAHRGTTAYSAPENTVDSWAQAAAAGYQYAENDVQATSDGQLVVLHDTSLNRTFVNADGSAISGTVNIADITLAQAKTYVLASSYGKYKKTIPTLDEHLWTAFRSGVSPVLEIKYNLDPSLDDLFLATIRKYFKDSEVVLISFFDNVLLRLRPKCSCYMGFLSGSIANAVSAGNSFVNQSSGLVDQTYMDSANAAGVSVGCWTVNTQSEFNRLARLGVRYITTDWVAPNDPSVGKTVASFSSGLNFTSAVLSGSAAISAGQGVVTLSATGASVTTPALNMTQKGAVYASITLKGDATLQLIVNGVVNETITVNPAYAETYVFAKLVNTDTTFTVKVYSNTNSAVQVYELNAVSKTLIL